MSHAARWVGSPWGDLTIRSNARRGVGPPASADEIEIDHACGERGEHAEPEKYPGCHLPTAARARREDHVAGTGSQRRFCILTRGPCRRAGRKAKVSTEAGAHDHLPTTWGAP